MSKGDLRYDQMVETALRGVVRQALQTAADFGLSGNHHFYITFRTDHPDVALASHLVERYPSEMTIVLQHQFWGLRVEEAAFEVTLSFNDRAERLHIPFAAITSFADPSVRFGLQFEAGMAGTAELEPDPASKGELEKRPEGGALAPIPESVPGRPQPNAAKRPKKKQDAPAAESAENSQVVSLDAFRKK